MQYFDKNGKEIKAGMKILMDATGDSSGPSSSTTTSTPSTAQDNTNDNQAASGDMVWIPKSGSKYHSYSGCSNMKNPQQVTKQEAENKGYEPCKKCW